MKNGRIMEEQESDNGDGTRRQVSASVADSDFDRANSNIDHVDPAVDLPASATEVQPPEPNS